MSNSLAENLPSSGLNSLARSFSRLGRIGFWLQAVMGTMLLLLMGYFFVFARSPSGPRAGLALVEYLTAGGWLILIFTTLWFYRYIRLARRMADPQSCPPAAAVIRLVWTGLVAGSIGILFSMLVMIIETAHLLFYFLAAPQGGVPVIQTPGAGPMSWVSAIDMASLMALNFLVFAELMVLMISLWLLFRTQQAAAAFPQAPEA